MPEKTTKEDINCTDERDELPITFLKSPKQPLTAEEALDALSDRSHLHPNTEKVFGPELTKELLDILEDPEIFELDAMLLQGDLTIQEMEEYLMLLPTFHELNKRLKDWADKIIIHVTRRLEGILRESIDRKGRFNNKQGLVKMQKNFFEMFLRFLNFGHQTERNALIISNQVYLHQAMMMHIWYQVSLRPELQKYQKLLQAFFLESEKLHLKEKGYSYAGFIAMQTIASQANVYALHKNDLNTLLEEAEKDYPATESDPDQKEKIQRDFEAINELSYFRTIESAKKQFGPCQIEVFNAPLGVKTRVSNVAYVKVSFPGADPKCTYTFPKSTSKDGTDLLQITPDPHGFLFTINRNDGELYMAGTALSADKEVKREHGHTFMTEQEFLRLKAAIYSMLREYLEQKPEDIDKVFFCQTEQTDAIQKQTAGQVEKALTKSDSNVKPATEPQKAKEEPVKPTWVYTPYQPAEQNANTDLNAPPTPDQQELIIQDVHLDGTYGQKRTIEAICRITKLPPLKSARSKSRGDGSHVVVHNKQGARFPLPCHAGKDLSDRILRGCLKKLNIPHSVFKAEY